MNTPDYLQIYDLEAYLLDSVRPRFLVQGYLSAFDFFCIIIWKANRAKTKIAKKLISHSSYNSLEDAVCELTQGIYRQATGKERLCYMFVKWEIWLPTASAILTILYPDEFTVYDYRVCDALGDFHKLNNLWDFEMLWSGYLRFREAVIRATPDGLSLRDRDRYLWGKSFTEQLAQDVKNGFGRIEEDQS